MKTVYFFQSQFSYIQFGTVRQYWFPYTAGAIWVYAKQHMSDWQLGGMQYKRDNIEDYLDSIEKIDLACFCTYVWNKEYNIEMSQAIKKKFPNCHISFGGPQVTKEYLEFSDSICLGEGEVSLVELMTDISANRPTKSVYENPRMPNLENLPSPYTEGVFDSMIQAEPGAKWAAVFETNRGCPYSCTFCEWGGLTASKIFQFDTKRIQAELEWFRDNPVAVIFLADANFGIFKDRDLQIAKQMNATLQGSALEYISMNYAKNSNQRVFEIAKILGTVSKGITISVQSMNPDTLKAIKRQNMKVNNFADMMKLAEEYNTYTYTELILGLPLETKETWKRGLTDLMELGQHNKIFIQKGLLLPNTDWAKVQQEQYSIETVPMYDFIPGVEYYDNDKEYADLVISTNTMNRQDMHESFMYGWMCEQMHYNGYSQIIAKWLRTKHNISYRNFYDCMFEMIVNAPNINHEYNRISSAYLELQRTGKVSAEGILTNTIEVVSRKVFYQMYDNCINFAVQVGEQFVSIPQEVIELQRRFLKNTHYTTPYTVNLDVNFETQESVNTSYNVIDIQEYYTSFTTGTEVTRGGFKRNKLTYENINT